VGDSPPTPVSHSDQLWNRAALLIHQALFRIAWIFKTESVIMPAFLDTISESGLIRGALPLLNRAGQSLAPLLLAQQLARTPLKKLWLSRTTFLMGAPFLFLSACIWLSDAQLPPAFACVFLTAYVVFFCMHGINEMTASTVLGKLIATTQRGRLQAAASAIGTTAAVSLALLLLSRWLQPPGQAPFQQIFCFVGSVMMLAGISSRLLREHPDLTPSSLPQPASTAFRRTWLLLREDPVLRRLCLVAVLFIFSQTIFPHYQSIGLARSGRSRTVLMHWVVAQHIGAACFSAAAGFLADRTGVRSALRLLLPCAACAPLLAAALARYAPPLWYWITFFWIGLVPVTLRMQVNYAIEITARQRHPEYISTLNLCMALPFLASPFIGGLVDWVGHEIPFLAVAVIVATGAVLTWTMSEPRTQQPPLNTEN
jgi:predicted MFS family arabinose efflux permease